MIRFILVGFNCFRLFASLIGAGCNRWILSWILFGGGPPAHFWVSCDFTGSIRISLAFIRILIWLVIFSRISSMLWYTPTWQYTCFSCYPQLRCIFCGRPALNSQIYHAHRALMLIHSNSAFTSIIQFSWKFAFAWINRFTVVIYPHLSLNRNSNIFEAHHYF